MTHVPILMILSKASFIDGCVCLQSIVSNISNKSKTYDNTQKEYIYIYDFYICIDCNLDINQLEQIREILNIKNVQINFIYSDDIINKYDLNSIFDKLSTFKIDYTYHTFLRLFLIFELKEKYDKVIYIDSDFIVLDDITNLYNIDLKDAPLGAVMEYASFFVKLGLNQRWINMYRSGKCFNAGILLLNLEQICTQENLKYFKDMILEDPGITDQDILNERFNANYVHLDAGWMYMAFLEYYNVYNSLQNLTINQWCNTPLQNLSRKDTKSLLDGIINPKAIHYAARECKPLVDMKYSPCCKHYWKYASSLPFFDEILAIKKQSCPDFDVSVYLGEQK